MNIQNKRTNVTKLTLSRYIRYHSGSILRRYIFASKKPIGLTKLHDERPLTVILTIVTLFKYTVITSMTTTTITLGIVGTVGILNNK